MKERKFYALDICPVCGGDLENAGQSKMGNNILKCMYCNMIMLEKDADKIRKEQDENSKNG